MAYDPSPTTQDALSIIIQNFNNGLDSDLHIDDTNFVFNAPVVNNNAVYNKNTKLIAMPIATSGKYGRAEIYYNRMDVTQLPTATISRGAGTKMADVIAKINDNYGINIVAADYENDNLPANGTAVLRIKSTSLAFLNNLTFTLTA